jgi:hypothetical protein
LGILVVGKGNGGKLRYFVALDMLTLVDSISSNVKLSLRLTKLERRRLKRKIDFMSAKRRRGRLVTKKVHQSFHNCRCETRLVEADFS